MRSSIRAGVLVAALAVASGSGVPAGAQGQYPAIPRGAEVAKQLPPPDPSKAGTRFAKEIGWPEGSAPKAAAGFIVQKFAGRSPTRAGPTCCRMATCSSANRPARPTAPTVSSCCATRTTTGRADETHDLIVNVRQPFGLLLKGEYLYVGSTNALLRYPFAPGQTKISAAGTKLLDLPVGGFNYHWTRDVVASADGSKLFISVGSGTNVDEEKDDVKEPRRATVLEVNPDGTGMRIVASGLRNPVGLAINPVSKALWTVVNERDMLGDELVPDYLTSVKDGAFYGWPYWYYGQLEDPRKKGERPDLVAKAIPPDYALGAHVAPLGLHFYQGSAFPERYRNGAFISLHGSWNRTRFNGYKVVFVPFKDGEPSGPMEDVLTGFVKNEATNEVYGRPVGIAMLADGSLLVVDDAGSCVWRISAAK